MVISTHQSPQACLDDETKLIFKHIDIYIYIHMHYVSYYVYLCG